MSTRTHMPPSATRSRVPILMTATGLGGEPGDMKPERRRGLVVLFWLGIATGLVLCVRAYAEAQAQAFFLP
jgi:hypothetical protein